MARGIVSEHAHQVTVIEWWDWNCSRWKLPRFALFAVPNAGAGWQRGQAGKMKAEGLRAGIPDLVLAVVIGGRPGLYIEMKSTRGPVSDDQHAALKFLAAQGYVTAIARSADQAIACIEGYLRDYQGGRP